MTKMRTIPAFAAVLIICCGAADGANAQDQPIKRTELIRADVANVAGKETVIYIADVQPGAEGARHTHYGDEFVYVLEGSLTVTPDGKDPVTLKRGEVAHLAPADGVHAAKTAARANRLRS